jgi:hypothetical protein
MNGNSITQKDLYQKEDNANFRSINFKSKQNMTSYEIPTAKRQRL